MAVSLLLKGPEKMRIGPRKNGRVRSLPFFARPLATVAPRDLLLLQSLNLRPDATALEIGTGCGSSLFRFARSVAVFHGLDIATKPIQRIRDALSRSTRPIHNVQLFILDFCNPRTPALLPTSYDLIFSCDTLEHVGDPETFFANLFKALKPGGHVFLTFPNENPRRAHGITFFERRDVLQGMLQNAGFSRDQIQILILQMNRWSEWILKMGWFAPRQLAKRIFHLFRHRGSNGRPQTFDQTDFFAASDHLEFLAPVINAYCWALMWAMSLAYPVYRMSPAPEQIWDTQILVCMTRSAENVETPSHD